MFPEKKVPAGGRTTDMGFLYIKSKIPKIQPPTPHPPPKNIYKNVYFYVYIYVYVCIFMYIYVYICICLYFLDFGSWIFGVS